MPATMIAAKSALSDDSNQAAPYWWRRAQARRLAGDRDSAEAEVETLNPKDRIDEIDETRPRRA